MATTRWLAVVLAGMLAVGVAAAAAGSGKASEPGDPALVKGNSEFGFDLYARLRAREGNVFFSSYSISNALAMTYAGARGPTASQMATVLRFPMEGDRLHQTFAKINRDVNAAGSRGGFELYVANALWPQMGMQTLPAFQETVKNLYGAGLTPVDFKGMPEKARMTINAWVEQQTRDRIKDLIPEGVLTSDTRVVLTNAIYFKGKWKYAFPEAATRNDTFTLSTGKTVGDVPLMRQQRLLRYLDGGSFQALELPYDGSAQSMVVFLPKGANGLAELEKTLTAARVTDWLAKLTPYQVDVTLPRFKVTAEFQLKDTLTDLGMPLAFSLPKADFSGIATVKPLALSAVIHKAFVDVNEKGTEAATATASTFTLSGPPPEEKIAVFRADHPFFFAIRDSGTGSLLFAGRLVNPQAK
jgi:serpin B